MKDSGIEWIGEIPEEWHIEKIKFNVFNRNERNDMVYRYPYVALENIEGFTGRYIETENNYDVSQANIARCNDVLFGKLRPYLAKVFIASYDICVSGEFAIFHTQKLCNVYLKWFMLSHGFLDIVNSSTYGAKMPRANIDFIKNCFMPICSIQEQQKIADFLDGKCAKIGSLIAHEEATIEELKAYKQSVITEAVTKGLDKSVSMKDSGVEWIGKIPMTWQVCKLSQVCQTLTDFVASGSFADLKKNVKYLDEPDYAMLIRTTDLSGSNRSEKKVFINEDAYKFLNNSNLFGGEIVLPNIGASCGDVYIVPKMYKHMSLAPNSIMLKTKYNDKYYFYFFKSKCGRELLLDLCASTAQQKFNKTELRLLNVPLLPLDEQNKIVLYLDNKCAAIDSLISVKQQKIEELKEFKKSLIYEYVTGKKEVA